MTNYGKKFEDITRNALEEEKACYDRLPDQMTGMAGSTNPSDFIAYRKPYFFYIECKSCQDEIFTIKDRISQNQWSDLLVKSKYSGVFAGYLIWFVKEEKVFWVTAKKMNDLYKVRKSFRSSDLYDYGKEINIEMGKKYPKLMNLLSTITRRDKK